MSGTGMKQAQQTMRGAKRRESAKLWGRNVTGSVGTVGGKWLLVVANAVGDETSEGVDGLHLGLRPKDATHLH